MSELTNGDMKAIGGRSTKILARWWWLLNTWKWPEPLPNPDEKVHYDANSRRAQLMRHIETVIATRVILRDYNDQRLAAREVKS